MTMRFCTYNPLNLYKKRGEEIRWRQVEEVIRTLNPDVLAIQELAAADLEATIDRLQRTTGLTSFVSRRSGRTRYAATAGNHDNLGLGLFWRPSLRPAPGTLQIITDGLWHALVLVRIGSVTYGCYHAPPRVGRDESGVERERVKEAIMVARASRALKGRHVMIGGDWNSLGAERVDQHYYDPRPDFAPNLAQAAANLALSRRQGEALIAYGLHDAPAVMQPPAPWRPSTGHWPHSLYGHRLIDKVRVSEPMIPRLRRFKVVRNKTTLHVSDHLPVIVEHV